ARHLLARPRQAPRDAGIQWRGAARGQPRPGAGDRRDRRHHRRGAARNALARGRAGQFRIELLGRRMDTCMVEVGLLKKHPCGEKGVAKCANCEMALCVKHAVGRMSGGKKIFLCQECARAWKESDKLGELPSTPAAAPGAAKAAEKPAAAPAAAKVAVPPKPAPKPA